MSENNRGFAGFKGVLELEWVRPLGTLLFVIMLATVFSPYREGFPVFWHSMNLFNVLRQISEIGILAVGMTLVIITAGIDLSVGSILALSATLFALTFVREGWPLPAALVVSLLAATAFGLANGLLITRLRMQPFIATLATMTGSRGFAKWLVDNENIDIPFGEEYSARVADFLAQKSVVIPTFAAIALIGAVLLNRTRFGRYAVAIGGSEGPALIRYAVRWVKSACHLERRVRGDCRDPACAQSTKKLNAGVSYELDAIGQRSSAARALPGVRGVSWERLWALWRWASSRIFSDCGMSTKMCSGWPKPLLL